MDLRTLNGDRWHKCALGIDGWTLGKDGRSSSSQLSLLRHGHLLMRLLVRLLLRQLLLGHRLHLWWWMLRLGFGCHKGCLLHVLLWRCLLEWLFYDLLFLSWLW